MPSQSHKIFVSICKWNEKTSTIASWTPLYSKLFYDGKEIIYDAYGRQFGDSRFQVPREMQKQEINQSQDVRYYCFEDYGEKTLVYKEIGYK